ncbi:hypothetical protein AFGD_010964 [Aspergillus flavus]|nr:hypothetical protein AFGD_010964 [Aspergillus flavus]
MTGFGTLAVRSGLPRDSTTGVLVEPVNPHLALNETISLSTTFSQDQVASPKGAYIYSRSANLNRKSFEKTIADLEAQTTHWHSHPAWLP